MRRRLATGLVAAVVITVSGTARPAKAAWLDWAAVVGIGDTESQHRWGR
ncbi:hypothetical protein [Phytohabitans suffuscus]|nr:hypothetical protein [Phytohabitans suffuscus]